MRSRKSAGLLSATHTLELLFNDAEVEFETEYRFHSTRRWRFDFAFPKHRIALEIEGFGRRNQSGGHQTTKGFRTDLEKYDEAARLGWNVYRCSTEMALSGHAAQTILIMISHRKSS